MEKPETIVVKLGTSTLTHGTENLSRRHMLELARQMAILHEEGKKIVVVSSGAIAAGREVLPKHKSEKLLPSKQMLSAVGQGRLMQVWAEIFSMFGLVVGQVLLTRGDFSNRLRYLNVRDTFLSLLQHRVIPIVNENDTVATYETRVGDNDNLSAHVANMVAADLLMLLTDQQGLYTADPRTHANAELIPVVSRIDEKIFALAKGSGTLLGTGGMYTKVEAALLATQGGARTVIASSSLPNVVLSVAHGKQVGTLFLAQTTWRESRKRWLLSEKTQGTLHVDAGAADKILNHGASLLAAGIVATSNTFDRGATVQVVDKEGRPIAVGLSNYSSDEIQKLIGLHSQKIEESLGYSYGSEILHRDNMTLLKSLKEDS